MNDKEFRAFLNLLMVSDPWPMDTDEDENTLIELANNQAWARGFPNWVVAYHEFGKKDQ